MEEFTLRRERLLEELEDDSVAIIYAGYPTTRSEDEHYPFHANRNFFYLTNIEQENSILVLVKTNLENKAFLFIDEYNPVKEKWTGKKLNPEEASELSGIQNVYSLKNFDSMISLIFSKKEKTYGDIKHLYLDLNTDQRLGEDITISTMKLAFEQEYQGLEVIDLYPLVVKLRMVKTPYEIECLLSAINVTHNAINDLVINMKAGTYEYALADRFEFYGRSHGRLPLAFSTIVAAGKNAIILHHPIEQQNTQLENNDLVLYDLGLAYKGYSADVSRTYPVSGMFSDVQRKIYEAVLTANKAVIAYAKPGLTIMDLQEYCIDILNKECRRYGLLEENEDIKSVYYHNVSHHLGLDTHDASFKNIPLQKGNVITVEPGLYFEKYGIGVRIEDDILIMDGQAEVLTKNIKKEISDIEKMFVQKSSL